MESKAVLRRAAEQHRRETGARSDLDSVLAPLLGRSAQTAAYLAGGSEPSITPRRGWLLPVLLPDGDLDWAADSGAYQGGRFGIREPVGPRLGVEAISTCDLVLVPALLVDRNGYRLGRGGGSYDRALARTTALTVALLHDGELVEELPHEDHDVPVAAVAMPSRGIVYLPG